MVYPAQKKQALAKIIDSIRQGALASGMTAHQRRLTGQSPRHRLGSEVGAKQTLK